MTPMFEIRNDGEKKFIMNFVIFFNKNHLLNQMPSDIITYNFYEIRIIYRPMHNLKRPFLIESGILD